MAHLHSRDLIASHLIELRTSSNNSSVEKIHSPASSTMMTSLEALVSEVKDRSRLEASNNKSAEILLECLQMMMTLA